jgi:16S rRNA (adenine1518-N6/adenine1519-N6)-dimethyltransferase
MGWEKKKKSFGQHALHEKSVISRIGEAMDLKDVQTIVEIGPGGGALTRELVHRAHGRSLVLVEADRELIAPLSEEFPNATIITGDAAQVNYGEHVTAPWIAVGNLPYNASAAILQQLFQATPGAKQIVIMVQKEQAERMTAKPGEMSLLSLAVQLYSEPKTLFDVGPGAFTPPPKVDSRVLSLSPRAPIGDEEAILAFAKPAFLHRRKQLKGTVGEDALRNAQLPLDIRPQALSVDNWRRLHTQSLK